MLLRALQAAADEGLSVVRPSPFRRRHKGRVRRIADGAAQLERGADLSAEVVLAQIRWIIVDLLQVTGLGVLEATDASPPPRR